ncbi:hypothetical protein ACJJIU_22320 (plasmid) [Microbulbifer sp. CnH-101-E]|uniref:hypothetical protein n=1 Tax=unclassified Microbulbifer TaxID=2619833 RepID=UPI004039BA37
MARSYRQLTEEERKIADTIWWVQARDLDDDIFQGKGAELFAVFDLVGQGSSIGRWCFACRTASLKTEPFQSAPECCGSQHSIKLYSQQQAEHLQNTPPLAERLTQLEA